MEPLPETRSVLKALATIPEGHPDLVGIVQRLADRVVEAAPDCLGLSITYRAHDLTFSYLRTGDRVATLDGVQYLDDGPCEQSLRTGEGLMIEDVLDEGRWQLLAQASAATGVRSSLSLPIRQGDRVVGSVNFYGTTANAFAGDQEELARLFGAWVEDAVRNADLSMSTVQQARSAPALLAEREVVDRAVGALASSRGISTTEARERLADAALRAGTTEVELARAVVLGLDV